jgi:hypothetical protein
MARLVFIVARGEQRLHEEIRHSFAEIDSLPVIVDRRLGERRRCSLPRPEADRRRGDRRVQPDLDEQICCLGWVCTRVE